MDMIVFVRRAVRGLMTLAPLAAMLALQWAGAPTTGQASFMSAPIGVDANALVQTSAGPKVVAAKLGSTAAQPAERSRAAADTLALPISAATVATKTRVQEVAVRAPAAIVPPPQACVTKSEACPSEPQACCQPRTDDEIWLVSSRCLGCPDSEGTPYDFGVMRYDLSVHQWNASTLKAFLAAQNPSKPDVIWVHGYRIDADEAEEQGLGVYQQLTCGAPNDRAIRLIIYSWAATPCAGIIEDTRMKAARTNSEGYYLAWLVNQIDRRVNVDFIGYSFGARIVTGALELLAGGSLMGRTLPAPIEHRAPMQAILIAAAVEDDWLAMGHPHGEALNAVDRMLALNNGCDRALKHYALVDPCVRPEALGYTGAVGPLGDNGRKLYEIDLCCTVGKQHSWKSYFYTPSVVARMRPYVGLGQEAVVSRQ